MKKTLFESREYGNRYLYVGIDNIYGEFMLETGGDPTCLNELEDAGCEELIETINNVIADPNTYWESCDDDDDQYIAEWLEIWGIA